MRRFLRSSLLLTLCITLVPAMARAQDEPSAPAPLPDDSESPPGATAAPAPAPPPVATPAPAPAPAPISGPRGASGRMLQPPSQYLLPIESGALDSHVDLQFLYSYWSLSFGGRDLGGVNIFLLGLEAQVAFLDRLEVGLNIPFLVHAYATVASSSASASQRDTEFGNIALDLKVKIVGESTGSWAVSAFANTILPTGTGLSSRDFAATQLGAAGSGTVSIATFGADMGAYWFINGNGSDSVLYLIDLFGGVRIHPMFAAYLGFQIGVPVKPSGGDAAFAIAPGLQFFPIPALHIDLGTRIAVNDAGRAYTPLGRANLTFAAGYRF